ATRCANGYRGRRPAPARGRANRVPAARHARFLARRDFSNDRNRPGHRARPVVPGASCPRTVARPMTDPRHLTDEEERQSAADAARLRELMTHTSAPPPGLPEERWPAIQSRIEQSKLISMESPAGPARGRRRWIWI